ncbi:MAG: tetratricopeptide repeat protein, partial [Duncaniella sp.]|nr:tetratricopeptide repeat protein [Duncaniella sp.]
MNFRFQAVLLLILAAIFPATAQRQADDPMTVALMKVYDQLLDEDPRDPETLFRRGSEYYNLNDYVRALDDINNALKYMDPADTDFRQQALVLRSNILMMQKKYERALEDLNVILENDPSDYAAYYQRGTANYNLDRLPEAKKDFQMLRQLNPRSQEALFGLARVAVKENNLGVAGELCDMAVGITPSNSEVYMRRASVRTQMANYPGAVEDYIYALSTDAVNTVAALRALADLSRKQYPVVIAGLTDAIRKAPRNGLFYFIRGMIAQGHCNYLAAIADYDTIINNKLDSFAGINGSLAECYYYLGRYDVALLNIDYAIAGTEENSYYLMFKSRIERAMQHPEEAVKAANAALVSDAEFSDALIAKALAQLDLGESAEASVALSEVAMNDPENALAFLLRGWVLSEYRNQPKPAAQAWERILDMDYDFDDIRSLKGFALLYLDRKDEAEAWMKRVLDTADDFDGEINYYAACLYSQMGLLDRAFRHAEVSLDKGYA